MEKAIFNYHNDDDDVVLVRPLSLWHRKQKAAEKGSPCCWLCPFGNLFKSNPTEPNAKFLFVSLFIFSIQLPSNIPTTTWSVRTWSGTHSHNSQRPKKTISFTFMSLYHFFFILMNGLRTDPPIDMALGFHPLRPANPSLALSFSFLMCRAATDYVSWKAKNHK